MDIKERQVAREGEPSIDEVRDWLAQMGKKGIYNPTTARNRSTALARLTSVLSEGESRDAAAVLRDIEALSDRWSNREVANPSTARTYLSRAKTALEEFFEYQEDPRGFKPRGRRGRSTRSVRSKAGSKPVPEAEKSAPSEESQMEAAPSQKAIGTAGSSEDLRTLPLKNGDFVYSLPSSITMADVGRIAHHLAGFADDFEIDLATVFQGSKSQK